VPESTQFEPPTTGTDDQSSPGSDSADIGFAEPDESQLGGSAEFQASTEMLSSVSDEIMEAHQQVADAIHGQDRSSKLQTIEAFGQGQTEAQVQPETLVQGVAVGLSEPGLGEPGKMALHVYTSEETTPDQVRAAVSSMGVQALDSGSVPLVTHKATFDAQEHRFRIRPAPGGVSVGHPRVTAGTYGGLCIGRRSPRNVRLMVLSNNHVLANSNNANAGDCIAQPGYYDGGRCPADQIAILESYVPIRFGGPANYVDAATAWCWPDRVRGEHIYRSGTSLHLFNVGSSPLYPQLGMIVGKTGRTTQLTQGRITQLGFSGWVNYGVGYAWFTGQFIVQSTSGGPFSAGGDSGSWVWQWVGGLPPVGLLFAGGGGYTICNPMPWVTSLLDVNLVTKTFW
jgi:hypothetical protein